jgi:hypothetical protein
MRGADFEKAGQRNIGVDDRLAHTFCLFKVTDLERTVHVFAHLPGYFISSFIGIFRARIGYCISGL